MAGNKILGEEGSEKEMSISAEEATYCIFNDIRVTSSKLTPDKIAHTILDNRKNKVKYYNPNDSNTLSLKGTARTKGDMTRYAGDILDYMEGDVLLDTGCFYPDFQRARNPRGISQSFKNKCFIIVWTYAA